MGGCGCSVASDSYGYKAFRNRSLCGGGFLAPVCPLVTWEVVVILLDCSKLSVSALFFFLLLTLEIGGSTLFSVTETKWHGPPSKVLSSYKERALQKDGSCKDSPNKLSHVSCLHMASHTVSQD